MHHFMLPKVFLVLSQRPCQFHFIRPKTHVLGGFARFRCRKVSVAKSGVGVHKIHHFVLSKEFLVLSQRTCPIHFFSPKTRVLDCYTRFRCRKVPVAKMGVGVHTMHHFVLQKVFLLFSQRKCPIHFLSPKTRVLGCYARFCCRKVPVARMGVGVHTIHHFVLPKVFLVFSQRTCPIKFFSTKTRVLGC